MNCNLNSIKNNTIPRQSGITNKTNNKLYLGSAYNLKERLYNHTGYLRRSNHANPKLQRAVNKYGLENFDFKVLCICSKENVLFYEQRFIDNFDSVKKGYNINPSASSGAGRVYTEEQRVKMRLRFSGRKLTEAELEGNKKARAACSKYWTGRKQSEETKRKISEALAGRKLSKEHVDKLVPHLAKINYGASQNENSRANLVKGVNSTNSIKARNSNINARHQGNFITSEETKNKLRYSSIKGIQNKLLREALYTASIDNSISKQTFNAVKHSFGVR